MKKIRTSQASISINFCTEFNKTQFFPVFSILNSQNGLCSWRMEVRYLLLNEQVQVRWRTNIIKQEYVNVHYWEVDLSRAEMMWDLIRNMLTFINRSLKMFHKPFNWMKLSWFMKDLVLFVITRKCMMNQVVWLKFIMLWIHPVVEWICYVDSFFMTVHVCCDLIDMLMMLLRWNSQFNIIYFVTFSFVM